MEMHIHERWRVRVRVHRCHPRFLTKLTTAAASSLCHLAGDDEILQRATEFHLKDTPLQGGCRQRWFWACRLWSSSPDRLTTARRGRLSRRPRSWETLLLSGQRAPAAPVTTRKEARRGQRRSAMDRVGVYRMWQHNPNRGGKDLLCLSVEFLHAFSIPKKENTFTQHFNRENPGLCWTVKKGSSTESQLQWPESAEMNSLKLPARGMAAGAQPRSLPKPPPSPTYKWTSFFTTLIKAEELLVCVLP